MSHEDLILEIERLRSKMHTMATCGVDYTSILKVSKELDELIVFYHRFS